MTRENLFKRIFQWNRHRDNLDYDLLHELHMLNEEFTELSESDSEANELKELADIIFVAVGAMTKKVGYKRAEAIMDAVCMHNEAKTGEKINGKVTKLGVSWKAEDRIQELLDIERPVQTTMDEVFYKGA